MSFISSINGIQSSLASQMTQQLGGANRASTAKDLVGVSQPVETGAAQPGGFGKLFEGMIDAVDTKQTEASNLGKSVMLGNTDQIHQSVIAMQEASVAFSLMVEVRNKLVDSYQELMRMPV